MPDGALGSASASLAPALAPRPRLPRARQWPRPRRGVGGRLAHAV